MIEFCVYWFWFIIGCVLWRKVIVDHFHDGKIDKESLLKLPICISGMPFLVLGCILIALEEVTKNI